MRIHQSDRPDDEICLLFGRSPGRVERVEGEAVETRSTSPARLTIYDAPLDPDSITAQVEFADGSCGQLVYSAEGDSSWPKETCTVFGAGLMAEIQNFKTLVIHRQRKRSSQDFDGKGHAEQMAAWTAFLRGERPHPMPFEQARRSTLLTFAAVEAIQQGRTIEIEA